MKKYIAIGHWRESMDATISIATTGTSLKDARHTYAANEFVPYVIISEKKFNEMKDATSIEVFEQIQKMTSNYRKWNLITDYIDQCFDIMEEKLSEVE